MKLLAAIITVSLFGLLPFRGAEPTASDQDAQLATLVKEIQAQNAAMAENQKAIEAKLATVAESVRLARIYTSRAGR
jgi:hypothetical protein